jgi:molybdopterin-guanine dinucleotide biosynthesis protein A
MPLFRDELPAAPGVNLNQEQTRAGGLSSAPLLLYGVLLIILALFLFFSGNFVLLILTPFSGEPFISRFALLTQVAGGVAVWLGAALGAIDCFVLLPGKRIRGEVPFHPVENRNLTVVLTAYNDEESIGEAVKDFLKHTLVRRVIVVDNNSRDRTSEVARQSGAEVVLETKPGYGKCVHRALTEGASHTDTDLTLLCEGDMTFRSFDIDKFMAYIPHAQIVNGTRIVEQLRSGHTQLTTFMYYGNFFVGKLLEAKHIGRGTFTDVGTTYKLCRNSSLKRLLPHLNSDVNLEFNAHFLDTALQTGEAIVECPITFYNRVGLSKGGNTNNSRALKVGLRMILGIIFSWPPANRRST